MLYMYVCLYVCMYPLLLTATTNSLCVCAHFSILIININNTFEWLKLKGIINTFNLLKLDFVI